MPTVQAEYRELGWLGDRKQRVSYRIEESGLRRSVGPTESGREGCRRSEGWSLGGRRWADCRGGYC
jgi:hypothetical protein